MHLVRVGDCLNAATIPLHDVFVMPVAHSVTPYTLIWKLPLR
ncbi:hypothetical protein UVIVOLLU_CDS0064 [Salmonella phage PHA46_2]